MHHWGIAKKPLCSNTTGNAEKLWKIMWNKCASSFMDIQNVIIQIVLKCIQTYYLKKKKGIRMIYKALGWFKDT